MIYYFEQILLYVTAGNRDFTEEDLKRKINELDGKGEKVMTILERYEKRGIEKGIEQGMREGMQKTKVENAHKFLSLGVDAEIVAKGTGLSLERVLEIKKEIQHHSE